MSREAQISQIFATVTQELKRVRTCAGLSQAELAERMGTKQASITRMENDTHGAISLRRIADYALACGFIPCNLCDLDEIRAGIPPVFRCIPLEEARQCTLADPQEPLTWNRYVRWKTAQILKELGPPQYSTHNNGLHLNCASGWNLT